MALDWTPVFILPNVSLKEAIGCDVAAIAPPDDPRVSSIKKSQPVFARFLKRFADNFGEKFEPSVLLLHRSAPPAFSDVAALASFRDLIAISVLTYSRALELLHPQGHRVMYGEAFAFYPWMLDRHYERLIGKTPAIFAIHDVTRFRGQSSPSLFRTSICQSDIDQPLLSALMESWERCYTNVAAANWKDVALMRSLNMAYNASFLPAGTDTTFYDVGRIVGLWISAFEILERPGRGGKEKVLKLLKRTPWAIERSGHRNQNISSNDVQYTLASQLYDFLYRCRNSFFHGNPVGPDDLIVPVPQQTIFKYAAPLYRLALTAFLPLNFSKQIPGRSDPKAWGAYIADRCEFLSPQKSAEKAILTALDPPSQMQPRRSQDPSATQ